MKGKQKPKQKKGLANARRNTISVTTETLSPVLGVRRRFTALHKKRGRKNVRPVNRNKSGVATGILKIVFGKGGKTNRRSE